MVTQALRKLELKIEVIVEPRRISVEVNVLGRDIGSFVEQAQADVGWEIQLPPGYIMQWGGLWENLESGRNRLLIVVPVTFMFIFMLLFATFHSARLATLVFTGSHLP